MEIHPGLELALAFFVGSIPFGWVIAKLWGVADLRKVGSSNVGATNVVRTAGWLPGGLTFLLDFLKGLLPMLLITPEPNIWIGFAAILGHCFSPFLSFHGGKGVSTTLGALVALNLWLGIACILTYLLTLAVLRVSAVGSLFAMLVALTGIFLFGSSAGDKIAVTLTVFIVLHRHRSNWQSLLGAILMTAFLGLTALQPAYALTDFRGKEVVVEKKSPQRIVALMPALAEAVIDLGAKDRLIGAPEYTRLPKELSARVKKIGPYHRLSGEFIYSLKPDLVLASMDGNQPSLVQQLERLGVRVVTINTQSLDEILRSMQIVAAAIGEHDAGILQEMESALKSVSKSTGKNTKSVFVQVGWEPVITVSQKTFVGELIHLAGGNNVFANSPVKYPRPNAEEILAANPDVIVICQLTDDGQEARKAREYWKRFKDLKAVKTDSVHIVPGDWLTKPGLPLVKGLQELKKIL